MIRVLVLLIVFVLGVAAAVAVKGRMHHLRMAVPDLLPDWTELVAEDAGLLQGRAMLPASGPWPATELAWTARAPGRVGWVWDLRLTGDGVALQGQAVLDFWPDRAVLSQAAGSVDLARVEGIAVPVQGIARVEALTGVAVGLLSGPVVTGALQAALPALRIDGDDFGHGPLTGVLDAGGGWRADLALEGGVSPVTASLVGTVPAPLAQLEIAFADGPALPATLRGLLSAAGRPDGAGWRLALPVPVPVR